MNLTSAIALVPDAARQRKPRESGLLDLLALVQTVRPPEAPADEADATRRWQEFEEYNRRKQEMVPLARLIIDTMLRVEARNEKEQYEKEKQEHSVFEDMLSDLGKEILQEAGILGRRMLVVVGRLVLWVASMLWELVAAVVAFLMANPLVAAVIAVAAIAVAGYYYYKRKTSKSEQQGQSFEQALGTPQTAANAAMHHRDQYYREQGEASKGFNVPSPTYGNFGGPTVGGGARGSYSAPIAGTEIKVGVSKQAAGKVTDAVTFFQAKGWSKEQAAGIAANLYCESAMRPDAKGDYVGGTPTAYGIAQWHRDRRANFYNWKQKNISDATLEEQLAFVDYELSSTEGRAGAKLHKATTATEAGAIVSQFYERPADVYGEATKRGALAEKIAAGTAAATAGTKSNSEAQTEALKSKGAQTAKPPPSETKGPTVETAAGTKAVVGAPSSATNSEIVKVKGQLVRVES